MANTFMETEFTEAHREATTRIIQTITNRIVAGIAQGRKVDEAAVRKWISEGPYRAEPAVELGIVTGVAYDNELTEHIKRIANEPNMRYLHIYRSKKPSKYLKPLGLFHLNNEVAYIPLSGSIHEGASQRRYDGVCTSIGSTTTCRAIRSAAKNKRVKAIILHVDSRGGSAIASDLIDNEIIQAKLKGKKVVAVMASVAASGGYYISQHADLIIAKPCTFTGSIGVVYGKFLTEGMWEKLGVTWDEAIVTADERKSDASNALVYSGRRDFNEEQDKLVNEIIDGFYNRFVSRAAEGRGVEFDELEAKARGRVWTGEDALEKGLVDRLGGLVTGIDAVKELCELKPDAPIRLVTYPKSKSFLASLLSQPQCTEDHSAGISTRVADSISSITSLAARIASPLFGIASKYAQAATTAFAKEHQLHIQHDRAMAELLSTIASSNGVNYYLTSVPRIMGTHGFVSSSPEHLVNIASSSPMGTSFF